MFLFFGQIRPRTYDDSRAPSSQSVTLIVHIFPLHSVLGHIPLSREDVRTLWFLVRQLEKNHGIASPAAALQESTWDFHRERQERMNAEARLEQLKKQGETSESKKMKPVGSSGVGGQQVNVAAKQQCREGSTSNGNSGEDSSKPDPDRGTEACSVRQSATDSSGGGGRKRTATEMDGESRREALDVGAHTGATTVPGSGQTSPKILRPSKGKAKLQQSPWSPLDRLCDVASTFHE